MTNEYINYPVGTVFKEEYYEDMNYHVCYYIVGEYFVYCNDYYSPAIRPWKFNSDECKIASEDEKKEFIKNLEKNNLIWDEETGKVERKYEERTLSVKVQVKPGIDLNKLLEILNTKIENPFGIYNLKFEDF